MPTPSEQEKPPPEGGELESAPLLRLSIIVLLALLCEIGLLALLGRAAA